MSLFSFDFLLGHLIFQEGVEVFLADSVDSSDFDTLEFFGSNKFKYGQMMKLQGFSYLLRS